MKNESEEIWAPVNGFEQYYCVSNKGRIKTLTRAARPQKGRGGYQGTKERISTGHLSGGGYYMFDLLLNGRRTRSSVHRLVAAAFIPNYGKKLVVNHIDSNPLNNNVENLEWCTPKENVDHCVKMGRMHYKITAEDARTIKQLIAARLSKKEIADLYNVTISTIHRVATDNRSGKKLSRKHTAHHPNSYSTQKP